MEGRGGERRGGRNSMCKGPEVRKLGLSWMGECHLIGVLISRHKRALELVGHLVKMQILVQQFWRGTRFCISNKLPGDADAAGP